MRCRRARAEGAGGAWGAGRRANRGTDGSKPRVQRRRRFGRRSHRPAERPGRAQRTHALTRGSIDANVPEDPLDVPRRWRTPAAGTLPRRGVAVLVQLGGDGAWQDSLPAGRVARRRGRTDGRAASVSTRGTARAPRASIFGRAVHRGCGSTRVCPLARITTPRVRAGRREHTARDVGRSASSAWHQTTSRRRQHRVPAGTEHARPTE